MISIFTDKSHEPGTSDLEANLGSAFNLWRSISDEVLRLHPHATCAWHYSGEKYGWQFRIKDHKRVLVYFLPRKGFFKIAFVFGEKAVAEILKSNIDSKIKTDLKNSTVYAEGRGIRIEIRNNKVVKDIIQMIRIKITS